MKGADLREKLSRAHERAQQPTEAMLRSWQAKASLMDSQARTLRAHVVSVIGTRTAEGLTAHQLVKASAEAASAAAELLATIEGMMPKTTAVFPNGRWTRETNSKLQTPTEARWGSEHVRGLGKSRGALEEVRARADGAEKPVALRQ